MRKWALCLAVVMLVALAFTGCNQTPAEETDGTTTTASTSGGKADAKQRRIKSALRPVILGGEE